MIIIEITKGEEIIEKVTEAIKKNKIKDGSITLIGGLDSCCIGTMPKDNTKNDILTEYHEPLELTGTGEIIDGQLHIHVALGREDTRALMGHLHWGKVETWFVHVYITKL